MEIDQPEFEAAFRNKCDKFAEKYSGFEGI
jgi:hypothetical protein